MIGWIIAALIGIFLLLILLPRIYLDISAGDGFGASVRVWRILRIGLYPKKQKKIRISDYSAKKIRKRRKKLLRKQQKKLQKKSRETPKKPVEKQPLTEQIKMILDLLGTLIPKFAKYLRIDLTRIMISVATPDAASTAILYGTISQSVSYLLATLDQVTNLKTNRSTEIDVRADFLSEKTKADIKLSLSISPFNVIRLGVSALFRYLSNRFFKKK